MNLNSMLRYGILAGIFFTAFIPFIVPSSMFFPFITGKNFAFRIVVEIIFAAWLVLMLRDRTYMPRLTVVLAAFSAFIAVIALADIFGVSSYKSFWSNYERMEGFVSHLHFFAYFLVAGAMLDGKLWERFFKTSLGASAVMCVYGLAQLGGVIVINQGGVRLDGTFGNAAYLAIYMVFHIFIASFFLVREWRNVSKRWMYIILIALELYILYFTATRGAILGLIAGAFLSALLIAVFGREYGNVRKTAIWVLAGVAILVGGFLLVRNTGFVRESPVLSRFASISLEEKTTKSRFMIWNMAWQGALERPVLGWGQENFNFVFNKYYDPRMYDQEQWFDRTHNIIFDWLIAGGFLGLAAYIFLFGSVAFMLWRIESFTIADKSILTGMLAAYFVHNFFVFDNLVSYIIFFSFAAYAHSMSPKVARRERTEILSDEAVRYGALPAIAILLVLCMYFVNMRPISANTTLIDALQAKDPVVALSTYKKVFDYGTFGSTEARERLLGAARTFSGAPEAVRSEYISLARTEISRQLSRTPNDSRHLLFAGSFHAQIGLQDEALSLLERAVANSPKKQTILMETASVYLQASDHAKALEYFRRAFELEPSNAEARIAYAVGALHAGDTTLADTLLSEVAEDRKITDERLLYAYDRLNMTAEVAAILEKRIESDPKNPQHRLSLAASYLKAGARDKAIATLEAIKSIDQKYAKEVDYYIAEIRAGRNPAE